MSAEFICPITQELMDDPVIGNDGHTYERKAIQQWLQTNNKSPMTRDPMMLADIKPNYALKSMIERYKKENGISTTNSGTIRISFAPPNREVKVIYNDTAFSVEAVTKEPLETALIMILDESGSMDSPASRTNEAGPSFSRRDLVKHSSRVVANMLHARKNTMLGIIGFSSSSRVLMNTRVIGEKGDGMDAANHAIDSIRAGGGTNVWEGLRAGLVEAEAVAKANPHSNIQVILLTDGEPSDPVDMILRNLQARMKTLPSNITVNAFGFGYDLNTEMLDSICSHGKGMYGYIPDVSMVGTVFINYCAHILSTVMMNYSIAGKHFSCLEEGTIYMQEHSGHTFTGEPQAVKGDVCSHQVIAIQMLLDALKKMDPLAIKFEPVKQYIQSCDPDEFLSHILEDIESTDPHKGQLSKSISSLMIYNSWGKNHIVMYKHALEHKICANFKEQGLQHFAKSLFKTYQTIGNDLFASLPYPIPSNMTQQQLQTMNFSMTQFNTQDGGCFDGECWVSLQNNITKKVKDIVKGDVLDNGSIVKCVVSSMIDRVTKMIRFPSGLLITPWHPIRTVANTCWQFPCYANATLEIIHIDYFYDFVVEGAAQYATISGWEVACLGHGMTDNEVISHPYYGTDAVLEVLSTKEGWEKGFVEL
jgi:Mg-chelatase subunit ChlD